PECTTVPDVPADGCGSRRRVDRFWLRVDWQSRSGSINYQLPTNDFRQGTARNFCRIRNSGYWGKNTSAIKTLFGASSRVEIVSLYSIRSCGLTRIVAGLSAMA